MIISTIFAPNWFRMNISVIWIKRESGVNPGQSRCCEAPFNILKTTYATDEGREGFRMGVSQKTCHSLKAHVLVG